MLSNVKDIMMNKKEPGAKVILHLMTLSPGLFFYIGWVMSL